MVFVFPVLAGRGGEGSRGTEKGKEAADREGEGDGEGKGAV